jgi:hypothetical protein
VKRMLVLIALLAFAGHASAKGVSTTTCGESRCRTTTDGIVGIAVLPGSVATPRVGRFYTVELRGPHGWKVVYEARRGVVRAADVRSRSFLGRRWARLMRDVRPHFADAVRGLAPMTTPPR